MNWKYKKSDVLIYNNKLYCTVVECVKDVNNYHYYEIASLNNKPFFTKYIDKNLLEINTSLDKNFNRKRKINRLFKNEKDSA